MATASVGRFQNPPLPSVFDYTFWRDSLWLNGIIPIAVFGLLYKWRQSAGEKLLACSSLVNIDQEIHHLCWEIDSKITRKY